MIAPWCTTTGIHEAVISTRGGRDRAGTQRLSGQESRRETRLTTTKGVAGFSSTATRRLPVYTRVGARAPRMTNHNERAMEAAENRAKETALRVYAKGYTTLGGKGGNEESIRCDRRCA